MGVAERVTFLGEVRDIPALLSRARMFVQPSLSEGIPLTVLEAMARGLPVVATGVGGLPEVVIDGETGLLVPAADPPALAEAVLTLWRDPDAAGAWVTPGDGRRNASTSAGWSVSTRHRTWRKGTRAIVGSTPVRRRRVRRPSRPNSHR